MFSQSLKSEHGFSFTMTGNHKLAKLYPLWPSDQSEILYVWPERGLVHTEYSKTNGYESMSIRDALERTRALSEMVGRSNSSQAHLFLDERLQLQRFIEESLRVIQVAKEQGDPFASGVAETLRQRRKKSVCVNPRAMNIIEGDPMQL